MNLTIILHCLKNVLSIYFILKPNYFDYSISLWSWDILWITWLDIIRCFLIVSWCLIFSCCLIIFFGWWGSICCFLIIFCSVCWCWFGFIISRIFSVISFIILFWNRFILFNRLRNDWFWLCLLLCHYWLFIWMIENNKCAE